jgi:endonuclease G, mitochondrial
MDDPKASPQLDAIVSARIRRKRDEIEHSLDEIFAGNPMAAEPDQKRRIARLQSKANLSKAEATMISNSVEQARQPAARPEAIAVEPFKAPGPEAIIGQTLDFIDVVFLVRGRRAANAVARIATRSGRPQGSGFLVAPGLLLTNHHVIGQAAEAEGYCAEFDYEYGLDGVPLAITRFAFAPAACFVTDGIGGLDFTLIALGDRLSGTRKLADFGYIPLSDAGDKHMLGEVANVIQHPMGRFKEVVLRENRLVARDETLQVLHYIADTEQGSSGSPVCNNEWQPIALHHWAGPWREVMGLDGRQLNGEVNEGIRVSAIVKALRKRVQEGLAPMHRQAVQGALALWQQGALQPSAGAPAAGEEQMRAATGPSARSGPDGSVTWTFPIEISVRAPLIAGDAMAPTTEPVTTTQPLAADGGSEAAAAWKTEDFSDRGGYEPGFIPGFEVPFPSFDPQVFRAAANLDAESDDDPHELRYHHFSILMNADRRLAAVTACNIDGKRIKAVVRDTKTVISKPTLGELGIEALVGGPEASDDFRPDRRVDLAEQMTREFYEKQIVAGFPDPQSQARIARIFQKGHIVLRGDPAWGTVAQATVAERDTFFYTNAAPQLGFFNQGSPMNKPGTKGKLRWRAVETYVLRNAVTMRQRVTVFAGPIFADDDPPYRFDSQVPMRFWKIAVWSDGEALRSIALIADQRPLIKVMPEAMLAGSEAFEDEDELARVSEFLTKVEQIEALTGLDFGAEVRRGDVRRGEGPESLRALDFDAEALNRPPKPQRTRKASKTRKR